MGAAKQFRIEYCGYFNLIQFFLAINISYIIKFAFLNAYMNKAQQDTTSAPHSKAMQRFINNGGNYTPIQFSRIAGLSFFEIREKQKDVLSKIQKVSPFLPYNNIASVNHEMEIISKAEQKVEVARQRKIEQDRLQEEQKLCKKQKIEQEATNLEQKTLQQNQQNDVRYNSFGNGQKIISLLNSNALQVDKQKNLQNIPVQNVNLQKYFVPNNSLASKNGSKFNNKSTMNAIDRNPSNRRAANYSVFYQGNPSDDNTMPMPQSYPTKSISDIINKYQSHEKYQSFLPMIYKKQVQVEQDAQDDPFVVKPMFQKQEPKKINARTRTFTRI